MTQIIRVSKVGINAVTGTAPDDLAFSSDYNTLKYHLSGTMDLTNVSDGTVNGTVAHNLGYTPFFTAYVNRYAGAVDPNLYNMCPGTFKDINSHKYSQSYVDTNNLYFTIVGSNTGIATYTFRYFIFRNNLGI